MFGSWLDTSSPVYVMCYVLCVMAAMVIAYCYIEVPPKCRIFSRTGYECWITLTTASTASESTLVS